MSLVVVPYTASSILIVRVSTRSYVNLSAPGPALSWDDRYDDESWRLWN